MSCYHKIEILSEIIPIAYCRLTLQVVVKTEKGNTSGMQGHLRTSHPEQFIDLRSSREANESFDGGVVDEGEKDLKVVAQKDVPEPFEWNRPKRKKRSLVWNYFEQMVRTLFHIKTLISKYLY